MRYLLAVVASPFVVALLITIVLLTRSSDNFNAIVSRLPFIYLLLLAGVVFIGLPISLVMVRLHANRMIHFIVVGALFGLVPVGIDRIFPSSEPDATGIQLVFVMLAFMALGGILAAVYWSILNFEKPNKAL